MAPYHIQGAGPVLSAIKISDGKHPMYGSTPTWVYHAAGLLPRIRGRHLLINQRELLRLAIIFCV